MWRWTIMRTMVTFGLMMALCLEFFLWIHPEVREYLVETTIFVALGVLLCWVFKLWKGEHRFRDALCWFLIAGAAFYLTIEFLQVQPMIRAGILTASIAGAFFIGGLASLFLPFAYDERDS